MLMDALLIGVGGEVRKFANDQTKLRCRPNVAYGTLKNAIYFVVRAIICPVGLDRTSDMHPAWMLRYMLSMYAYCSTCAIVVEQ